MATRALLIVSLAILVMLSGCNNAPPIAEGVVLKGKLLENGEPIAPPELGDDAPPGMEEMGGGGLMVALVPTTESEDHVFGQYEGAYDTSDGSLVFMGRGKGVPPGRYVLVIEDGGASGMPDDEDSAYGDTFSVENSPFKVDVSISNVGKEQDIGTFDLAKPNE